MSYDKIRGHRCDDIDLPAYLTKTEGPVTLVLDLRIAHDRWESNSNPSLNGYLHYPTDIDRKLNETTTDKILQYRTDYNNRPSHFISFMPTIPGTARHLLCGFVNLLFLQTHRETDRFLGDSEVQVT